MLLYVDAQYASPYAMSVFVGLKEKGIPFDMRTVDLATGANRAPDYAGTSLTQRVPTLVDGEFQLSESSAITEYLDEVYPGAALYPAEPKAKARARQIQAWLRSDLLPIRQERSTEVLFYRPSPPLFPPLPSRPRKSCSAPRTGCCQRAANTCSTAGVAPTWISH